jgi:hypothetical protein
MLGSLLCAGVGASLLSASHPPQLSTIRPAVIRSAPCSMGISDRTASDGLLYDSWGAEGVRVLNRTASLQQFAETEKGVSRYDTVLIVAARAKENAYRDAEEQTGYIGSSFDGRMGSGMRRPPPAKSQVVSAVEELLEEAQETGELPELITPGTPEDLLEEELQEEDWENDMEEDFLDEESRAALAAAEADAAADAAAEDAATAVAETPKSDAHVVVGDSDGAADDELLANLLGEDFVETEEGDEFEDTLQAAEEVGDLFSQMGAVGSDDGAVEASGMSPGDAG